MSISLFFSRNLNGEISKTISINIPPSFSEQKEKLEKLRENINFFYGTINGIYTHDYLLARRELNGFSISYRIHFPKEKQTHRELEIAMCTVLSQTDPIFYSEQIKVLKNPTNLYIT